MSKHRKLLSLLLAGIVVFGSAGCSGIKKNDPDSSSAVDSDIGDETRRRTEMRTKTGTKKKRILKQKRSELRMIFTAM